MALTSGQRKLLRQRAQKMDDDVRLGKAGLSPGCIDTVQRLLARQELVKLRFGKDVQGAARQGFASEVAAAVGAQCVAVVGRTLLLYRPNPALDADQRLLP